MVISKNPTNFSGGSVKSINKRIFGGENDRQDRLLQKERLGCS